MDMRDVIYSVVRDKMVKNTTGGKGHKSQKAEDPKAAKNRRLVDEWISDTSEIGQMRLAGNDIKHIMPEGTMLGRVTKRLGNGRMEVFAQGSNKGVHTLNIPLRGGMTGRAKKSMWVDVNKLVLISETGLVGASHEIVAVLEFTHIDAIRSFELDPKFFSVSDAPEDAGFEFAESDVDVDAI